MNFDQMFPSRYAKAPDFEQPRIMRISGVETETMGDGQSKPVLYFRGNGRGLVLNKTNAQVLRDLFGADTDDWADQAIEVFQSTTDYQGRSVACIRLRLPAKPKPTKPAAAETDDNFDNLDDEIPF